MWRLFYKAKTGNLRQNLDGKSRPGFPLYGLIQKTNAVLMPTSAAVRILPEGTQVTDAVCEHFRIAILTISIAGF